MPPESQAGNWRPSLPLHSGAHAGHTVSPSSREREIAQLLWEGLWNHIADDVGTGRGGRLEFMGRAMESHCR